MKAFKVYHPFLFSIYPVFAMAAANIAVVDPASIWRSLGITFLAGAAFFFITWALLRNRYKAGLVTTLFLLLASTYGHVYIALLGAQTGGIPIGQANVLAAVWMAVFILGAWALIRLLKNPRPLTSALNWIAVILVVPVTAFVLVKFGLLLFNQPDRHASQPASQVQSVDLETGAARPDIYLIILDGYARLDVLSQLYGYDNTPFLDFLESRGFRVIDQARSNYMQTILSIPSMLNYDYVDNLMGPLTGNETDVHPLHDLVLENRAQAELRRRGYTVATIPSGYFVTDLENADVLVDGGFFLNDFEQTYFSSTAAILLLDPMIPRWGREARLTRLSRLPEMAQMPSPKFVYFHLIAPHPPFLFGPNGEDVNENGGYDGSFYLGGRDLYLQRYPDQLNFINGQVEKAIDGILANSPTDPVIILTGDHGPGAYLDWLSADNSCFFERLSILTAYHLPGDAEANLYDTMTPVNAFRFVFDAYFGAHLGLLDDRSFFSTLYKPYDLQDVTGQTGNCP